MEDGKRRIGVDSIEKIVSSTSVMKENEENFWIGTTEI